MMPAALARLPCIAFLPQPVLACAVALALTAASGHAQPVPESREQISLSFSSVVREAAPAVVSIYARRVVEARMNPFFDDPLFGQLFGDFGRTVPRVQNALGSGVILSEDGMMVSNYHVVGGADEIRVMLDDRREFAAEVVLADEESDLAVLQISEGESLPVLELADSDRLEVGDLVLAIGNPFGVGQTVSSGIVSALARSNIAVGSGRGYFIQTDAAINPGNSGGALVDMAGRLVGINTAILTRTGGSHGIGFAIPSNLVAQVVAQAREGNKRFVRPWVGMSAQAVDASLAEAMDLGLPQGVVITDLHEDSPLRAGGLRAGDVIMAIDGEPVNSPPEMMFRLAARGIGQEAQLSYRRGEEEGEMVLALQTPPETPPRNRLEVSDHRLVLTGLVAETVNPAVIAEWNLSPGASGVLVVEARDLARRAGLRAGDLIVSVNGQRVSDTAALGRALRERVRFWEVEVLREGRRSLLRFRL